MPSHLENEPQLVAQARAGNQEAFATLFGQYDRYIYRLAVNITRNEQDAEDVLQETAMKSFASLARFNGGSRFYTWLVRIAVNESLMKLRRRRTEKSVSLEEPVNVNSEEEMPREVRDWGETPEQRFSREELRALLNNTLAALDPAYRIVVMLRDVEELSNEEVADMLHLSLPAVKSRLLRGRLMLRNCLEKAFLRSRGIRQQLPARPQRALSGRRFATPLHMLGIQHAIRAYL